MSTPLSRRECNVSSTSAGSSSNISARSLSTSTSGLFPSLLCPGPATCLMASPGDSSISLLARPSPAEALAHESDINRSLHHLPENAQLREQGVAYLGHRPAISDLE